MQTQQQKQIHQDSSRSSSPKQRLSVGEVVVAVLNLLTGAFGAWIAVNLLIRLREYPSFLFSASALALGAFGMIFTGILVLSRQHRFASMTQWLGVAGVLGLFVTSAWLTLKNSGSWLDCLNAFPLLIVAIILAWFAWFLKHIDDSK